MLPGAKEAGYPLIAEMPFYVPVMVAAAGQFCLYRGLRSAMGDIWTTLTGRGRKPLPQTPPRRAAGSGLAEDAEPVSDFDADAAFARYMDQRAAAEVEAPPAQSVKTPAPRPRAGFGRRVV
jgi:hypothetical protein